MAKVKDFPIKKLSLNLCLTDSTLTNGDLMLIPSFNHPFCALVAILLLEDTDTHTQFPEQESAQPSLDIVQFLLKLLPITN